MHELQLIYYADDFTGATDALERLSLANVTSALFLSRPTEADLLRMPELQAVGVAGCTRSLPTDEIEAEIRPALQAFRSLDARHVHYKVCSTFDSSPTIGSIGRVIDVALEEFDSPFVPLVVGAPPLGRYCVFGNLFARANIGSQAEIFRLDRHPTMSKHPVTPADESDLCRHLALQTNCPIQLCDVLALDAPRPEATATLRSLVAEGRPVVLFDVLNDRHLSQIGQLLDAYGTANSPLFSVGSSAVETALCAHWAATGTLTGEPDWQPPGAVGPLLVVSGSCSPVTAAQISWAMENRFSVIPLDTVALLQRGSSSVADATSEIIRQLQAGKNVLVETAQGPSDPRIAATKDVAGPNALARILGQLLRECLEQVPIRRCCVAGGDTSTHAASALDIKSMKMISPLAPGAPLCEIHAPGSPADGLQMCFKGGQVGEPSFFGMVMQGGEN